MREDVVLQDRKVEITFHRSLTRYRRLSIKCLTQRMKILPVLNPAVPSVNLPTSITTNTSISAYTNVNSNTNPNPIPNPNVSVASSIRADISANTSNNISVNVLNIIADTRHIDYSEIRDMQIKEDLILKIKIWANKQKFNMAKDGGIKLLL